MNRPPVVKMLTIALLAGGLSACGFQLNEAKKASPQGTVFQNSLYGGYIGLSQEEFDEADYEDADVFAQRAMMAARGENFDPEEIGDREIPEAAVNELTAARARLMTAFGAGAIDKIPGQAARAQVMFDCWMQEQEEDFQPEDIEKCKAEFEDAMAKIDAAMKPMAAKPMPMAEPKVMPLPGPWMVTFGFDSFDLTPEAMNTVNAVGAAFKDAKPKKVIVTGHTDRAGNAEYNLGLSRARASSVGNALMEAGIPRDMVDKSFFGESIPNKATDDGTREQSNRRVEIRFAR